MTSDGETLFRVVCENPGDDTPRLVYADWLAEHGQPERAEFIRLQCGEWGAVPDPTAARTRASQLSKQHGEAWHAELPDVPGVIWSDLFVRGFVDTAWVKAMKDVRAQLAAVFAATPVQHLTVIDFGSTNLEVLFEMPEVGRLSTLRREGKGVGFNGKVRTLLAAARERFPQTAFF
jgi:uncharacterized protein (TIGR02996 family)